MQSCFLKRVLSKTVFVWRDDRSRGCLQEGSCYDQIAMASYLITGVADFIGSTLARAVLARGDKMVGFDNFSTGKRENISDVENELELHEADLLDLDALQHACRGIDYILHVAAIHSVPWSVEDPVSK